MQLARKPACSTATAAPPTAAPVTTAGGEQDRDSKHRLLRGSRSSSIDLEDSIIGACKPRSNGWRLSKYRHRRLAHIQPLPLLRLFLNNPTAPSTRAWHYHSTPAPLISFWATRPLHKYTDDT
jgi:hypothetical protein